MIEDIRQTILTSDFIFILILLGFILVVTLLLLENRRDNIRLKEINQKVKDLIAGDYSQVLDLQGRTSHPEKDGCSCESALAFYKRGENNNETS